MTLRIRSIDIWKFLFLYLIFQPTIPSLITNNAISTIFNYSDEVIGIILVAVVIFRAMKSQITLLKFERYMLVFMMIFEVFGLISGFFYDFQSKVYVLTDAYTCSKFFIYYLCARLLTQGKLDEKYFFSINRICKIIAVIFFVLTLHDAFLSPWFPVADFRYFTNSVMLFFEHPEYLARASMTVLFILAYNYRYYKHNIYYIIMLTIVMILTFRTKAIISTFIIYILYIYFVKFKFKSLLPVGVGAVGGTAYLGYDSLNKYYVEIEESARLILTNDGIQIANNYFPIGSGFGSFASSMAAQYYSKLYMKLGYYRRKDIGMGEGRKGNFLSDTFWPIVIAQTGWLGLFSFCLAIISMLIYIIQSRKSDVYYFWVALSIMAHEIIASFAESAFFHPTAMAEFLLLGLITSIHEFPREEKKAKD